MDKIIWHSIIAADISAGMGIAPINAQVVRSAARVMPHD
jgi:hypothetical protein